MIRRLLPTIAAVLGAAMLQVGLAPYISIGRIVPNFILLVVVTLALVEGPTAGAGVGFAGGLLFDVLGTGPIGPMAIVLTVTGYIAGLMHENMFAEGWLLPLTVLAIACFSSEVAYGLVLALLGEGGGFMVALGTKMLPGAVYDTVLAALAYPWLARFLRRDRQMTTFRRLA